MDQQQTHVNAEQIPEQEDNLQQLPDDDQEADASMGDDMSQASEVPLCHSQRQPAA